MKAILLIGLVILMGCSNIEQTQTDQPEDTSVLSQDAANYCVLTATDEEDGRFLMVSNLFSEKILCETNDDCYEFLLNKDDYRDLAPEFEPYLNCESEQVEVNR